MFDFLKELWTGKPRSKPAPQPQPKPEPKSPPPPPEPVDTTERDHYLEELLPELIKKAVEELDERIPEDKAEKKEWVEFEAVGFRNYTKASLIFIPDKDINQWWVNLAVPTKWDEGYQVANSLHRKFPKRVQIDYLNSPQGLEEIRKCMLHLDQARAHEGPR